MISSTCTLARVSGVTRFSALARSDMVVLQMSGQDVYPKNTITTGLSVPVRRSNGWPSESVNVAGGIVYGSVSSTAP